MECGVLCHSTVCALALYYLILVQAILGFVEIDERYYPLTALCLDIRLGI